jgi:hypothetical protein
MNSLNYSINGRSYDISEVVNRFHSFKRLNFKLGSNKNSTFDVENQEYIQSLVVFVAIPLLILILILLLYLIYSICICICGTNKKSDESKPCKVFIFVFGLVCAATFTVGLYGSWKIHKGINSVHNSTEDAVNLFDSIKNCTKNISNEIHIRGDVESMKESIKKFHDQDIQSYAKNLDIVLDNSIFADNEVREVNTKLAKLDIDSVPKMIEKYENIRWIVTISVLCLLAIFGFVCTVGVYSRCFLVFFTILGVISLIIVSIMVALSFGVSVGVSDFCISAKPFIKSQMNGMIETNIAEYYIECIQKNGPLTDLLNKADLYLESAQQDINTFKGINKKLDEFCDQFPQDCPQDDRKNIEDRTLKIESNLKATQQTVSNLKDLVDCRRINKDLNDSLNSICTDVIEGIVMILSNVIAASFCFIILVFCATYTFK